MVSWTKDESLVFGLFCDIRQRSDLHTVCENPSWNREPLSIYGDGTVWLHVALDYHA